MMYRSYYYYHGFRRSSRNSIVFWHANNSNLTPLTSIKKRCMVEVVQLVRGCSEDERRANVDIRVLTETLVPMICKPCNLSRT